MLFLFAFLAYVQYFYYFCTRFHAALAELVDALDLGSSFERSEGSSPLCRTSGQIDPIFVSTTQGTINIKVLTINYQIVLLCVSYFCFYLLLH